MKISQNGRALVKYFEGLKCQAYRDAVGKLTIGYGSTGPHVTEGLNITEEYAEELLRHDLLRFESGVLYRVKVPLDQDEFDALVSFTFNVGLQAFQESTLLRKLNAADYAGAAQEFRRWDKAGKRVLPGLTKRRQAESLLFQSQPWRT